MVEQVPQNIAVIDKDAAHSYADLAELTQDIRCHLQNRGIGPGVLVGVLLDRDVMLPAALMAVFEAGASYLPLDAGDPTDRHIRAIDQCGCSVVFGARDPLARLREVLLDRGEASLPDFIDIEDILPSPDPGPPALPQPQDRAYILLTSGSTGTPKAVDVTHDNVITLINSARERLHFEASDRYLATSPLTFDASIPEIFLSLSTGAAIVMRERDLVLSPGKLAREITQAGVTIAQTTPSTWAAIMAAKPDFPRLRLLISHGEAISPGFARELAGKADTVLNMYGPTETTVWATAHQLSADMGHGSSAGSAPIGTTLGHFETRILDPEGKTLGSNEPGELCLGGRSVTRGYRNDPERTEKVFFEADGVRFYRTGDLVQQRPDGVLEYLGRIDDQMAINGLRIEPGEIEAAILTHPRVQRSAVTWYPVSDDQRAIVAAITADPELSAAELRDYLTSKLGRAMLPARILIYDALPSLTSGKIDRKAIRSKALEAGGDARARADIAMTPTEETIAEIWRNLLRLAAVGPEDDFFLIGGDSLSAVEMVTKLEQVLQRPVAIDAVFETSRLRDFATRLDTTCAQAGATDAVMVSPTSDHSGTPLFFALADYGYVGRAGKTIPCPVYNLTVWNRSDGIIKMRRLEDLASRYLKEIRARQPRGPYQLAGYSVGGLLIYEVARQLLEAGEALSSLFLLDPTPPTKLQQGDRATVTDGYGQSGLKRRLSRVSGDLRNLSYIGHYRRVDKVLRMGAPMATSEIDPRSRNYAMRFAVGRMAARYVARPIQTPITLVTGSQEMREAWTRLLGNRLTVHMLDQDHRDLWKAPVDESWTKLLVETLREPA